MCRPTNRAGDAAAPDAAFVYLDEQGERLLTHLVDEGMSLPRACATAVRRAGPRLVFRFPGKSGIEHVVEIDDPAVVRALDTMRRRRGHRDETVLAYRNGRRWFRLDGTAVNDYLRELTGLDVTAKDFRTRYPHLLHHGSDERLEVVAGRQQRDSATASGGAAVRAVPA